MLTNHLRVAGQRERPIEASAGAGLSGLPLTVLAAGLLVSAFAADARAQAEEIPFSELRIIIETNATDCDVGVQLFFDGDPWREVKVDDPNGRRVLHVKALGGLLGFGLTEQFNESNEPVMEELVAAYPDLECDEPEYTLEDFFELLPAGKYQFEGKSVEGEQLDGEATLEHVIPAPPELLWPLEEDGPQDPDNIVIMWDKVEEPILPGLGRGPGDEIEIVGFHVVVAREDPEPVVVFAADMPGDATQVTVPPEFMEHGASYKYEVLQIDVSGNQTIAEAEFETAQEP